MPTERLRRQPAVGGFTRPSRLDRIFRTRLKTPSGSGATSIAAQSTTSTTKFGNSVVLGHTGG
jgi:hypothetical protein